MMHPHYTYIMLDLVSSIAHTPMLLQYLILHVEQPVHSPK